MQPSYISVMNVFTQQTRYSKLELNASLLRDPAAAWDGAEMKARALTLFTTARQIWPEG